MRIGRNLRNLDIPFDEEIDFSVDNNFDVVQLWYKRGHIDAIYVDDVIESINKCKIQTILHGAFDINDFDDYSNDFIDTLLKLNHKEVIIHPMIKTMDVNEKTDKLLVKKLLKLCNKLDKLNIRVYIENNHFHMQTFYTIDQWKYFWERAPKNTEFLLDIVHVLYHDDYEYMKELVKVKFPKALHIADTKKGRVNNKHLHIPIGDGIIDFKKVFKILKGFDGIIILEIKSLDYKIIDSRNRIVEYLKNI